MSAYLPKASLLFEMARYADAVPLLREALVQNPSDPLAHAMLGVALSRLGRKREALEETANAIGLGPTEPYCFYARSLVFIRTGHSAGSLWAIQEAIRLDPRSAEYQLIFGALLFDKRQWNRALAALDQALEIEPGHVRCLNLRARTLVELGRRDEAEQATNSAIAAGPENADAHHARGMMLLTRAQTDEALDHLLEARRLNPQARNDAGSIALAVGWRLPPFRWIGRKVVHWDLWPARRIWALCTVLMAALTFLNSFWFLPTVREQRLAAIWFGIAAVNGLLLPFTLDALAVTAAKIGRRKMVGSTWQTIGNQSIGLGFFVLLHVIATGLGRVPPLAIGVQALCSCKDLVVYTHRRVRQGQLRNHAFGLYLCLLGIAFMLLMMRTTLGRPAEPAVVVAFPVLAYFSSYVLRWVQRRERDCSSQDVDGITAL